MLHNIKSSEYFPCVEYGQDVIFNIMEVKVCVECPSNKKYNTHSQWYETDKNTHMFISDINSSIKASPMWWVIYATLLHYYTTLLYYKCYFPAHRSCCWAYRAVKQWSGGIWYGTDKDRIKILSTVLKIGSQVILFYPKYWITCFDGLSHTPLALHSYNK